MGAVLMMGMHGSNLPIPTSVPKTLQSKQENRNSKITIFQIAEVDIFCLRKLFALLESVQKRVPGTQHGHREPYHASACWQGLICHGNATNAEHEKFIIFKNMNFSKSWFFRFARLERLTVLCLDSLACRKPLELNKPTKSKILKFSYFWKLWVFHVQHSLPFHDKWTLPSKR